MIKSTTNLKEENGVSLEEATDLIKEGKAISKELQEKLSKIKINIDKDKSPELIEAIRFLFGDKYISRSGNSFITYDMYCSVLNLIRVLGKNKASEVL